MTRSRADDLRKRLARDTEACLASLEIFDTVGSTNAVLAAADPPPPGHWHVAIADEQTAGRGRGDNRWRSLPGAGLWMSAAYTFESPPDRLASLTLALGVSVAEAIRRSSGAAVSLKWPNDLVLDDGKLGGMLVELASTKRTVICGIGINFHAPDAESLGDAAALPPAGLADVMEHPPECDALAAGILEAAAATLPQFADDGLAPWFDRWADYDWLRDRSIVARQGTTDLRGIARGIDADGALLLDDGREIKRIVSASIRCERSGISA